MRTPFSTVYFIEHIVPKTVRDSLSRYRNRRFPLMPSGFQIQPPRIVNSTAEAQACLLSGKEPALWREAVVDTPLNKWNLSYLTEVGGNTPVKILALEGMGNAAEHTLDKILSFREFVEHHLNSSYLRFGDFIDNTPALKADLPTDLLATISGKQSRVNLQFFLGASKAYTSLHSEMNCNIFIQVFGKKRWVIFPTKAMRDLQPVSARKFYFYSAFNALAAKPKPSSFNATIAWDITLEPGDILLMPPWLWHSVENLTTSCSIGYKFNRLGQAFRASPLLTALNLLARNPSYFSYIEQTLRTKKHPILST